MLILRKRVELRAFSMEGFMKKLLVVATIFLATQAQALLEFNIGYQGLVTSSAGGNWLVPGLSMSGGYGLTADFAVGIPLTSWAFGIRYGKIGLDGSSGGQSVSMLNESTSALARYRFLDTGFLLGTVLTYAISNSGSLKNTTANTGGATVGAGSISQYTAGIELGIKIPVLLAAEFGYGNLSMSGFSGQTISGSATSVALSGPYARLGLGFSF
jgi:hypothetical protein